MKLSGIKLILFDLDDTLYESAPIYELGLVRAHQVLQQILQGKGIPTPNFQEFSADYAKARQVVKGRIPQTASSHNRLLYFKVLTEELLGSTQAQLTLQMYKAFVETFEEIDFEPARNSLRKLRTSYRLGIVTNLVAWDQLHKLAQLDPDGSLFEYVLTSEEVAEKPDSRIFREMLRRFNVTPKEVLMVGDSWGADVLGASPLGCHVAFLSPHAPPKALENVFWIRSLTELEVYL